MNLRMRMPLPPALQQPAAIDGIELRPAVLSDADDLARLLSAAFPGWEWTRDKAIAELLGASDVPCTWLAFVDGVIAGTASEQIASDGRTGVGVVHWVAVLAQQQGRGVGRLLTQTVLHGLACRGLQSVRLDTQDERHPAIAMYARLGFVPDVRSADDLAAWSAVMTAIMTRR